MDFIDFEVQKKLTTKEKLDTTIKSEWFHKCLELSFSSEFLFHCEAAGLSIWKAQKLKSHSLSDKYD
jgi:hypothetical protein